MLRFKVLVSAVPLIAAAILARIEFGPGERPCIAIGDQTVELSSAPWHADLHVSFTDDPRLATVRVAVTDDADAADFAVVDDADTSEGGACEAGPATQLVAIDPAPEGLAPPVIYLSAEDAPADYRVFVHSKYFTAQEAAALVVGAHGQHVALNAS